VERNGKQKPLPQIQSVGYVAALISKSPRTIYRAIDAGKIRVIRFGNSLGIPADEVRRICEKGF
jgi:excisionase family DNA binding protein